MTLANVGQAIFSAKWTIVFYLVLAGGTIIPGLWLLRTPAHANAAHRGPRLRRPRLRQVYPTQDDPEEDGPGPDIDIIAIHGLDTNSPDTWEWRVPSNRKSGPGAKVNWLADPDMLPTVVGRARISTCDWPANLIQQSSVPTTLHECAQSLRDSIIQHLKANSRRPVLFIASCLGGIILMKALEIDNQRGKDNTDSPSLTGATRGVVFLATPFRGTAFKNMPGFLLKALSFLQDQSVTALIDYALGATPDLDELTKGLITLTKKHGYNVFMFWEARNTLVNKHSATLSDFHSQRLDRPHGKMNKFAHRNCTDECKNDCRESEEFGLVSGKIVEMLQKIRDGSLLERADAWIRTKHYAKGRLKIERLSGKQLELGSCYINLAIIEESSRNSRHEEEGSGENASLHTSPFSLAARLKVETPDKNIRVELPSLFDPPKNLNGRTTKPRRILIRGSAGVGKTTLCKKMVDEFMRRSEDFRKWNELFDRVLWVPLRRLKEWQASQYDLQELFCYEFFAREEDRETRTALAKEMQRVVKEGRTLFILDGLDEIAQELTGGGNKPGLLEALLDQPNVIITSRPHVSLPATVRPPDLELETVGFYPDQVQAYLQATFKDQKKVEDVQSYLQAHQLIQGLVRIPIQLDALCYTWDNFDGKAMPQTMTAIYKAIEESLWKKDVLRLRKKENGELVTKDDLKDETIDQIESLVNDEVILLQGLAFTGLHNDVINFGLEHRKAITKEFKPSNKSIYWDRTLPNLSFLRTSDPSSDPSSEDYKREYHFLHLTFQEYFAARYFVRQWKAKQSLNCLQLSKGECSEIEPVTLLQEHKYDPRYDIFWRFVAGLLDADGEALGFFQEIEKGPRDLLGPTHQRLVMHCLSEVERKETTFTELRTKLEKQLEQWLLFECNFTQSSWLAREMECPEHVLKKTLQQAPEDARPILLESLYTRTAVPSSIIDVASPWLNNCPPKRLHIAILHILGHQHKVLPDMIIQGIAARLEDDDRDVRRAAVEALRGRSDLAKEILEGIAARLEDDDPGVRWEAVEALRGRSDLRKEILQGIAARLEDDDPDVRWKAVEALRGWSDLTKEILEGIAARLEDDDRDVRWKAVEALRGWSDLTKEILQGLAARLEDDDPDVRWKAVEALRGRSDLTKEILEGIAARLEHDDRDVRQAAVEALQGRSDLTKEILEGIAARLEDDDWLVRRAAVEALQGRSDLTKEILEGIAARLEDDDRFVRWAAVEALRGWSDLTKEILQGLAARLEDDDPDVRWKAVEALRGRSDLTKEILEGIAARLEDNDWLVRQAAVEALRGRSDLTKEILEGIAARLEDNDWLVRQAAVEALRGRSDLTKEILERIAARLEDDDWLVRQAAVEALQGQSDLRKEILEGIAARLEHDDRDVRQAAVEALQGPSDLTKEILQGIAARLEDDDRFVRWAAVKALQDRSDLTKEILQGIAARLEDDDRLVRRAAVEALVNQEALSLEILSPYVKQLYKALLQKSFKEHLYWYASDRAFIGVNLRHVSLNQPSDEFWEIRKDLGVPIPNS